MLDSTAAAALLYLCALLGSLGSAFYLPARISLPPILTAVAGTTIQHHGGSNERVFDQHCFPKGLGRIYTLSVALKT
jgi:hypothetical protein